jgi:hypothetical protein
MRWLFLIPFGTSLITGYIAQKSKDELAYLSAAMTVVTVFLSLVMAPWQIQLLILVVAVVIARQFWLKVEQERFSQADFSNPQIAQSERDNNNLADQPTTSNSEETIIRKYRGASYEVKIPNINVTKIEREGKYRGTDCKVQYLQKEKENREEGTSELQ